MVRLIYTLALCLLTAPCAAQVCDIHGRSEDPPLVQWDAPLTTNCVNGVCTVNASPDVAAVAAPPRMPIVRDVVAQSLTVPVVAVRSVVAAPVAVVRNLQPARRAFSFFASRKPVRRIASLPFRFVHRLFSR